MSRRTVTATIPPKFSKAARALLNLSQEDMAEKIGISPSTIRRYEGGIPMNAENDAKLVAFMQSSGIVFFYRDETMIGLSQGDPGRPRSQYDNRSRKTSGRSGA